MKKRPAMLGFWMIIMLIAAVRSYAAHPLITDDTGTQGTGKLQLEVNAEYGADKETREGVAFASESGEIAAVLSYGALENLDIVIGLPFRRFEDRKDDVRLARDRGPSDIGLELKWIFYEAGGSSLAFKPGVSFPAGNEKKGLGAGKYGYSSFLIGTHEAGHWAFHLNFGYMRNDNRFDEAQNLWHASLASEWGTFEAATIVANIGAEKNPDRLSHRNPSFALAGIIFAVTENMDLDLGVKLGLSDTETDRTLLAGLAWRI